MSDLPRKNDKVVLLDRDGVINADRFGYITSWDEFTFLPGVKTALRLLAENAYHVHVVSNQSAVGRGLMTEAALDDITARMLSETRLEGGDIGSVHYCLHRPEDDCDCRKPKLGLVKEVVAKYNVDLTRSWLVGDKLTDMELGNAAGCRTILVKSGVLPEVERIRPAQPNTPRLICQDLLEAVRHIIGRQAKRPAQSRIEGGIAFEGRDT